MPNHPTPAQIKAARKAASLSQAAAARLVGSASVKTWQDWEYGRRTMPPAKWELFLLKTQNNP